MPRPQSALLRLTAALPLALGALACGGHADDGALVPASAALSGSGSSDDGSLNLGAKWTKTASVTAVVKAPSGVSTTSACVALSDLSSLVAGSSTYATCTQPDVAVSGLTASNSKNATVNLGTGDGLKTVWVRFKQDGGNVAAVRSATIVLDTRAPDFAAEGATFAAKDGAVEVTIQKPATDVGGSGVAAYKVFALSTAYNAAAPAVPAAKGATGTALTCVVMRNKLTCPGLVNGSQYALRVVPVDFVGNAADGVASGVLVPAPASHDGAKPAVSGDSIRLLDGKTKAVRAETYVNAPKLILRLAASGPDGVKVGQYCVYEDGADCVWTKARAESATFSEDVSYELRKSGTGASAAAAEGTKTLYAKFRDVLGGVSNAASLANLVYDVTKPSDATGATLTLGQAGFSVALTGAPADAGSGLASANGGLVVAATDGADTVKGCTGKVVLAHVAGLWTSAALKPGTNYKVRVCAVDKAGNVSDGVASTASVAYRPTKNGPTGSVVALPTKTAAFTFTLNASGDAGAKVASYFVSESSTLADAASFVAFRRSAPTQSQAVPFTLTSTARDGAKTFHVWLKDEYGNVGALGAQSVVLDTTAPTVASATLALPLAAGARTSVYGAVVNVTLTNPRKDADSGDPTAVQSVTGLYKVGATAFAAADKLPLACTGADLSWSCLVPTGIDVSSGKLQVALTATDAAGNTSAPFRKEAATALDVSGDATAPADVTNLSLERNEAKTGATLAWTASASNDVVGYIVVRAEGNTAPSDCDRGTTVGSTAGTSLAATGLDAAKDQAFRVCAVDVAGNVSAGVAKSTGTSTGGLTVDTQDGYCKITFDADRNPFLTGTWSAAADTYVGWSMKWASYEPAPGDPEWSYDWQYTDVSGAGWRSYTVDTVYAGTFQHLSELTLDSEGNAVPSGDIISCQLPFWVSNELWADSNGHCLVTDGKISTDISTSIQWPTFDTPEVPVLTVPFTLTIGSQAPISLSGQTGNSWSYDVSSVPSGTLIQLDTVTAWGTDHWECTR
ncbi:MAG: hypothetical protein RL199_1297 [Pseudomonadota bacterium]|jgi:hypothetical protein